MVSRVLPAFELRPQQIAMAEAVSAALAADEHLLVEAGTGVGKSFAYLIPAIQHLQQHGGRVVVSTHTIALQEQLIHKDIPVLRDVFPDGFSAELVKGRSNYLGLRRLARASARQKELFDSDGQLNQLWQIEDWAYKTGDGSLSDLPAQPGESVWERVKSDSDDCFGRKCPHYQKCFYQRARERAEAAQLLIVNHALLFTDLAVREQGASILPSYEYLILDEAHTIERVAGDHLGVSLSSVQVHHLLNGLYNEKTGRGGLVGKVRKPLLNAVRDTRRVTDGYFKKLVAWHEDRPASNGRLREPPPVEQRVSAAFLELVDGLRRGRNSLDGDEDRSEFAAMIERCLEIARKFDAWHGQATAEWVYWLTTGVARQNRITLGARPIDVGPQLKSRLFDRVRCAVLTSATLTTGADDPFAYLRGRIGLDKARALALGSPFNYREQLKVYVEAGMPDPGNSAAFLSAACEAIQRYVRQTEGRAFVLFTSYDMLEACADAMRSFFEAEGMPLWVQGEGLPRSMMLEKFRSVPRSVLFGTDTFWTGVDVPGEALSNVIIVKLPFAVPSDPVVEARIERIQQNGGNPFMDFQVPEAVLKFRQGTGRLIRTKTDKGIVVILDPRVCTKPYGKRFLRALPECEVVIRK